MAEFGLSGNVEQISCSEVKAAESKRQEAGADLYSIMEKELYEISEDLSGTDVS